MIRRCCSPDEPAYINYGARGISVCNEWKESVENFYNWAIANGYDDQLTIDRIDNDGDYCPENCRWITLEAQSRNRRSNIDVTINGVTKTLTEWAQEFDVPYKRVYARVRSGWPVLDALTYKQDARLFPVCRKDEE